MTVCPVCKASAQIEGVPESLVLRFSCSQCGRHECSREGDQELELLTPDQRARLSSILRKAHEQGNMIRLNAGVSQRLLTWGKA